MNQKIKIKTLLATAALFGLSLVGRAADPTPMPASGTMDLLGQTYAGLTYSYIDLGRGSAHADNYHFDYNETLNTGLDSVFAYDWTQTDSATKQQSLSAALRAFSTSTAWGKPYVEAGVGYAWDKVAGAKDNSFLWLVAVGAEFQVTPAVTVTPFIKYQDTPSLAQRDRWDFGVKANYWVSSQWAVTAGLDRDDHQNTGFTVGTNFRF